MTRRTGWLLVVGATLLTCCLVGVPVWLIQPFAAQAPSDVALSWWLCQVAPWTTLALLAAIAAGAIAVLRGPHPTRGRAALRGLGVVLALVVGTGAAWFARQNHFEWMFRPFPDPRFVAAAAATDLPPDEPVIGIARGAAALAFPITRIGYHHLVNATLGDVPIVATY